MDQRALAMSLEEIRDMARNNPTHPFPYPDVRKLVAMDQERYEDLIVDLDMFFSDVAGFSSWGKGMLRWTHSKLLGARGTLEKPFFLRHPKYEPLAQLIDKTNVPALHAKMDFYEHLRSLLLVAITQALSMNP
jgi:hypothetical protein